MVNVKRISSLNVITIINGELFIDGVSAGLPTVEQLNAKQDQILFITLTALSGTLSEEVLLLLNNVNRLVYNNKIYYVSVRDGNIKKYSSKDPSSLLNEIDVNMQTGEYQIINSIDIILKEHIENNSIHVTQQEKDNWNNKVSAEATEIASSDYKLILSTD